MDLPLHLPRAFVEIADSNQDDVRVWQRKNWMRHAAIGWTNTKAANFLCSDYVRETRSHILRQCRPNLFRGLAIGTVLEIDTLPPGSEGILEALDVRQRERSVWQWAIVAVENPRVVIGLHIWMQVNLTQIFESLMMGYREEGYEGRTFKKDKDALMKFLTQAQVLRVPEIGSKS